MSGVDNRIVTMQFNNRDFETNARTSLSTLQKIKEAMNFSSVTSAAGKSFSTIGSIFSKVGSLSKPISGLVKTATSGFSTISSAFQKIGLKNPFSTAVDGAGEVQRAAMAAAGPSGIGALEGGVTAVSNKFIALTTIAITALSNITNRAVNAGLEFGKSFTVQPILDGLNEYQTNLQAIQTVQANTDRPLPEINSALKQLNAYSDQTIYNFGEMAKNVGTFTAAGVDLETSVSAIKGIANMAALSGSNSQQAATAMYQLSQALASGKVGLMDWNSVVNAGMGGKKLQGALAQTAVAMGKIDAAQIKGVESGEQLTIMGKSFRESIMAQPGQESWLTSDILKNSLATLDGRFSKAAISQEQFKDGTLKYNSAAEVAFQIDRARMDMAKQGVHYTDEQFAALMKLSDSAFEAATKVKTLGQVFDIAKETIGSGWSASFQSIFGNLSEAKKLFTGMSNGLNDILKANALARNNMLATWKKRGGRDTLIEGLKDSWTAFYSIIQKVGKGFHDIFPEMKAGGLVAMTHDFAEFARTLIPGKDTLRDIRDISAGVFSVLHIGVQIVMGIVGGFKTLFGLLGAGNGDFLDFAAGVGQAVTGFDKFLEKSKIIPTFFSGLAGMLSVPLALLQGVAHAIGAIFSGFDLGKANGAKGALDGLANSLSGLNGAADGIHSFFDGLMGMFENLGEAIGRGLSGLGAAVASFITGDAFSPALDAVNTGLLAAITAMIVKFFKGGMGVNVDVSLFSGIAETLDGVTGSLSALQTSLKADALMKIAISIGVLAAALVVLSMIDPSKMRAALAAMAAGFGVLIVAMALMMKVLGPVGVTKVYILSAAMTTMATAILILAAALKVFSSMSLGDMLRGLTGMALALKVITTAVGPLSASSKGLIRSSIAIGILAVALNILAVALKLMATMSWGEIVKGLVTMTGALVGIAIGLRLMPKDILLQAAAIAVLSVALNAMGVALKLFATMSWPEMVKGIVGVTGALAGIGLAMRLMPKGMLLQAAALAVVSAALVVLSGALKVMGSMGWDEIAKGLLVLGGAMLILAVGLQAIGVVGAIGAVGLLLTAAALAILVPLLLAMGAMSWESIGKSMAMLVGLFTILGVAATLAGVQIVILGAGMLLLGAGVALVGVGLLAMATAFGIVVAAGAAGAQVLGHMLGVIINSIPAALAAFGKGVVQFAVAIGQGAPRIAAAFGRLLGNLLDQVTKNAPKMGRAFMAMLNTALRVVVQASPKITQAGITLILDFLHAINDHVTEMTRIAGSIVVKFINEIGNQLPRIQEAGVRLIIKFINGTANAIDAHSDDLGAATARLGLAIVTGTAKGLSGAAGVIKDAAIDAAKGALDAAMEFLGVKSPSRVFRDKVGKPISQGMALGISDHAHLVADESERLGILAVSTMKTTLDGLSDAVSLDPNMNPTITPVLDLSGVTKDASKMGSILASSPIVPTVSYRTAADISAETQASAEAAAEAAQANAGDTYVMYEHHLHSPTPLDSVKIYRDGKSLISLKKEELTSL